MYFFSDIDNTLIYSHRAAPLGDRIASEYLNGQIQSYMTKKTYDFLSGQSAAAYNARFSLIPTTTRTFEQYARLQHIFEKFGCRYALVCNGGVLLDRQKPDLLWLEETMELAKYELPLLFEAEKWLKLNFHSGNIHKAADIMVYVKMENSAETAACLREVIPNSNLNIFYDRRKVYCIPASINKGSALSRFNRRFGEAYSIAAGDSEADLSMLEAADLAIMPKEIADRTENPNRIIFDGVQCFSDFICDRLSEFPQHKSYKNLYNKRSEQP